MVGDLHIDWMSSQPNLPIKCNFYGFFSQGTTRTYLQNPDLRELVEVFHVKESSIYCRTPSTNIFDRDRIVPGKVMPVFDGRVSLK